MTEATGGKNNTFVKWALEDEEIFYSLLINK